MLLNGILYDSEAWHSLSEKDIKMMEAVDEHLLRSLVKGHSKVPLEFLFLETGAILIRFWISSRRMPFLQTEREVTALCCALLEIRKNKLQDLLQEQNPSTSDGELRRSDMLQPCIIYSSLGNK